MKLEEEFWKIDVLIETEVDSIVINVHNNEDSLSKVNDFSSSSESALEF